MEAPHGQTAFIDGMRVTQEHLIHLQDILHLAVMQIRAGLGLGKVVHGLKAEVTATGTVSIGPGLAYDALGRPLQSDAARELTPAFGNATVLYAVIAHDLHYDQFFRGFPTVIDDVVRVELRNAPPPYDDNAVRIAEIRPASVTAPLPTGGGVPTTAAAAPALLVSQSGDWFLPPLYHGHSGKFFTDAQALWRYDGNPLGVAGPLYDSGFIQLAPGGKVTLKHGLHGRDFLAQLEASKADGAITNHGSGREYWYELPEDGVAVIARTRTKEYSRFRLRLWPFGSAGAAPQSPILPVANAGADEIVELGTSFRLDGTQSRSPAAKALVKFKWTQLS